MFLQCDIINTYYLIKCVCWIVILGVGALITLISVLIFKFFLYKYAEEISNIELFIAGLGINGLQVIRPITSIL